LCTSVHAQRGLVRSSFSPLLPAGAIVAGVLVVGPAGASSSGTEIRLATVGRGVVQSTVSVSGTKTREVS